MLKKVISYVGTGLAIGSVVSSLCLVIMSGMDETMVQVLGWLVASVCFGVVSLLFEQERLPLPLTVAIHGVVCFGITYLTAALLGYGAYVDNLALALLPSFLIIYVVILVATMAYTRHCAKKISEKLKK